MVNASAKPSVQMLKEVRLLNNLSEQDLSRIIALGRGFTHKAHSNIVIEGELSSGLYLIMEGVLGVFKTNTVTGDVYDVAQLRRGSFFGEMSLIDEAPRSATVKALTDCVLFYISKEAFSSFLDSSSQLKVSFYENCIRDLSARLRELDESYVTSQYQLWKAALKNTRKAAS